MWQIKLYIKDNDSVHIVALRKPMPLIQWSLIMAQLGPGIRLAPILLSACEWVKIILFSKDLEDFFSNLRQINDILLYLNFAIEQINILNTKSLIG